MSICIHVTIIFKWPLIIWIFQLQYVSVYLLIEVHSRRKSDLKCLDLQIYAVFLCDLMGFLVQMYLLHYFSHSFSKSDNKNNHHHLISHNIHAKKSSSSTISSFRGLADVYTLVTPCSRVSIWTFVRVYASHEYTHTIFIEKMFTSVCTFSFHMCDFSTSSLSVSIPSTWTRAYVCMITPSLFNPNKKDTCKQVNAKQIYIYAYKPIHIQWT